MNDHRTTQARGFRIERPEMLGAKVQVDAGRGKKHCAHAQFRICAPQLFQRRFRIVHRQNADALEARVPPQIGLGEPLIVGTSGAYRVITIYETPDALAGSGKKNGKLEPDLIHELDPSFGSRVLKAALPDAKGARGSARQRKLDMALAGEHAAA